MRPRCLNELGNTLGLCRVMFGLCVNFNFVVVDTDLFREQMLSYVNEISQPQYSEMIQKSIEKEEVSVYG